MQEELDDTNQVETLHQIHRMYIHSFSHDSQFIHAGGVRMKQLFLLQFTINIGVLVWS